MSDFTGATSPADELELTVLSAETREALARSALSNDRTVHEEAESIIKAHLSTTSPDGP